MRLRHAPIALLVFGLACVESLTPPEPTRQAMPVPYGPKIYLKDGSIEAPSRTCRLLGAVIPGSMTTTTATTVGGINVEDERFAYNCFVNVVPGTITVDAVEVTNELFQLCVDSGICKRPNPKDVEKAPICSDEGDFEHCPVVTVRQVEANRFCEFVGRRLPTGIESVAIRQPNAPQRPEDVTLFPTSNNPPGGTCSEAVLGACGKPQPVTFEDSGAVIGGARLDKTAQGVFDLTGNVSEWSSDLIPVARGAAEELPWFCSQALPNDSVTAPTCPSGAVCIFGTYRHPSDGLSRERPVCIAEPDLTVDNGTIGSVFGGNYVTSVDEVVPRANAFVRLERDQPNNDMGLGDTGFRCVDASGRPSAVIPVPQP